MAEAAVGKKHWCCCYERFLVCYGEVIPSMVKSNVRASVGVPGTDERCLTTKALKPALHDRPRWVQVGCQEERPMRAPSWQCGKGLDLICHEPRCNVYGNNWKVRNHTLLVNWRGALIVADVGGCHKSSVASRRGRWGLTCKLMK